MGSADAGEGPEHERGGESGGDAGDLYADLPRVRVTVPDDARDLDADVREYYRELKRRQAASAAAPPPPPPPAVALRGGRPGRMFLGLFALLLVVASLAMMISPRRDRPPAQAPLATPAGADTRGLGEGLLMPDLRVRMGSEERALLDLRPAVIALVPPVCRCEAELETIFHETTQYQLHLYLAQSPMPGTPGPDGRIAAADPEGDAAAALRRLAQRVGRGKVAVIEDASGRLAGGFAMVGTLTFVLVSADGTVADVLGGATELTALDLTLAQLSHPDVVHMESGDDEASTRATTPSRTTGSVPSGP